MAHRFPEGEKSRLRDEHRRRVQPAEEIIDRMSLRPHEVCADLGSGTGYITEPLARRTALVIALDAQRKMLEAMCALVDDATNIVPVLSNAPPLPLADATLDRIVLVNVLHEIEAKDLLVNEVLRCLRRGGRVSVVDFPRRETSFGPPVSERIEAEEVIKLFADFREVGRWDLSEYYQLELEKA